MEAIFLSSLELYKIIFEEQFINKFSQNSIYTLLKYLSRMITSCTSIKISAGISLGIFSNDKNRNILK